MKNNFLLKPLLIFIIISAGISCNIQHPKGAQVKNGSHGKGPIKFVRSK